MLTILAGVAIALFIGNKVIFEPLAGAWKSRNGEIAKLRQDVQNGQALIRREAGLRNQWRDMGANTLTNDASQAEQQVLNTVANCASSSRASVTGINNQWKHDSDEYMTLECRVEAAGDINTLAQFLYSLEKDPLALKLQSVEIGSRDNNGRQLTLGILISGLVLTPQEKRQ